MRLTVLSLSLLCALALTSGCGIKPGKVDAPPGVEEDAFPRVYPDPATDPQPHRNVNP